MSSWIKTLPDAEDILVLSSSCYTPVGDSRWVLLLNDSIIACRRHTTMTIAIATTLPTPHKAQNDTQTEAHIHNVRARTAAPAGTCLPALSQLTPQKINLDPTSSTTENLEALAPLIKSIQDTDSEQLYLRSLDNFVEEKEREIEEICQENYEVCRVNSAFAKC